jgi:hypothetical protein
MNESDPSSSSPSSNVIPLRPSSSSPVVSSMETSNYVGHMDVDQGDEGADEAPSHDVLPTIFLDRDFHVVLDVAMRAIAANDRMVFAKGDQLVRVALDGGSPRLLSLGGQQLREVLSSCARWMKDDWVHPPSFVANALAKRGQWKYVRELRAMTMFPVLSASGELRTEEGYDETTRTFYRPCCEVSVPDKPTQRDAKAACGRLLDLVADFPFAGPAHKTAWLAALLSPLSRFMHDGNLPLVVIAANAPGSGKTTLAQIVSTIVSGGLVSIMACEKGEPNRKELLSKLRASPSIALIDNVAHRFGGANMASLITSRAFEDRSLGHLKTLSAPNDTCWLITGNRVLLAKDMARRCLHVRLQCNAEKPHERDGFKHPNLMQHVREHRGELLSAALTILRAYAVAGFPDRKMDAWGSFEDFSRVVRGSLLWCGLADPAETRTELEEGSEEGVNEHAQLVLAWKELQGAMGRKRGATVKEALDYLESKADVAPRIREIIDALPRRGGQPDPLVIARRLREAKDRNFHGLMLQSLGNPKEALRWKVSPITS